MILYTGQILRIGFDTYNANNVLWPPDALPTVSLRIDGIVVGAAVVTVEGAHSFIATITLPTVVIGNAIQLHADWICATLPIGEFILDDVCSTTDDSVINWGVPGTFTDKPYLREVIVKETGRYDLVGILAGSANFNADNGIDFYIMAGQQLVFDSLPDLLSSESWTTALAPGVYKLYPPRLKVPQRVVIANTDHYLQELEHVSHRGMDESLGKTWANTDPGTPMYFTYDRDVSTTEPHVLYLLPPTDAVYTVTVHGLFYPAPITNSGQTIVVGFDTYNANIVMGAPDALPTVTLRVNGIAVAAAVVVAVGPHSYTATIALPNLAADNYVQLHADWFSATLPIGTFILGEVVPSTGWDWLAVHRPWLLIKAVELAIAQSFGMDIERRENDFLKMVNLIDRDSVHRDLAECIDEYGYLEIEEV